MKKLAVVLLSALPLFAALPSLHPGESYCEGAGCATFADINGDGLDDLMNFQKRQVSFNLGGTFGPPVPLTGISDVEYLTSAEDYNGDGYADFVLWPSRGPHDEGPNRMAYGNGSGGFTTGSFPVQYGGLGQQPPRDFNGDGKPDLVLVNFHLHPSRQYYMATLSFVRGNGDGTFTLDQDITFRGGAYPYMAIADFNGDGRWDLVRTGDDGKMLYFHFANANGKLGPPRERFAGNHVNRVQAADVNGDGIQDLVLETYSVEATALTVLFNDGRGRFPAFAHMPAINSTWGAYVADVFPGGGDEVAFTHTNGQLTVYSGVGNELSLVASLQIPQAAYANAKLIRFREGEGRDFAVTKRDFTVVPNTNHTEIVLVGGELPEVADVRFAGPRRARAMHRGSAGTRFAATVTGECAPAQLGDWSFEREGIFLDFPAREDGTQIQAAMFADKLVTRVTLGERVMSGDLRATATALRGYLYDRTTNPCGGTGRVLVDATRVH